MSFVWHGVDHRAGAQEQQALEERVREQVEQAGHPAADAQGQHHVAELADGRIGQHALDVDGRDRDRRRDEQRDAADVRDHQQHFGREHRIDSGRPGTRRRRPSSPNGRAPRRASGLPSRRATTRAAGTVRFCRRSRRRCPGRRRPAASSPSFARSSARSSAISAASPRRRRLGLPALCARLRQFRRGLRTRSCRRAARACNRFPASCSWLKMPGCDVVPSASFMSPK